MEDGIYIPREHFEAMIAELDGAIMLVDQAHQRMIELSTLRTDLLRARRVLVENDPDRTPMRPPPIPAREPRK